MWVTTMTNRPSKLRRILRWTVIAAACAFMISAVRSCGYGPYHWDVTSVDFSPDGTTLAVGIRRWQRAPWTSTPKHLVSGRAQTVKLLDVATGDELATVVDESYGGKRVPILATSKSWAQFSPNGEMIVTGHLDGTVYFWNLQKKTELITHVEGTPPITCIEFSPSGDLLIVGCRLGIDVWDLKNPEKPVLISDTDDDNNRFYYMTLPQSLSLSPDGKTVAVGTWMDGTAILDVDTGHLIRQFELEETEPCEFVDFSPDGKFIALAGHLQGVREQSLHLIDVATGETVARFADRYGVVQFSPDGTTLAIGGYKGLTLIDVANKDIRLAIRDQTVIDLVFSPDSAKMAIGDRNGNVILQNSQSGNVIWRTDVVGPRATWQPAKWLIALVLLTVRAWLLWSRPSEKSPNETAADSV